MEDTPQDKSRFVQAGRFDCKTLAKALPATAQALRGRAITAESASAILTLGEYWYLPKKNNPDEKGYGSSTLLSLLVIDVFSADEDDEVVGAFIDDLYEKVEDLPLTSEGLKENGFFAAYVGRMQQAFAKTLETERWKSLIQNLTGLPLQETCHLYKMPSDEFLVFVMEKLSGEFDTRQLHDRAREESLIRKTEYIASAAQGVADGLDRVETTCWECGSHPQVQRCSQCHVACYCSLECQKKSWKGGHKKVCKEMKVSFGHFKDDLELIDKAAAAAQDDTEATPKTNAFLDYAMLKKLWIQTLSEDVTTIDLLKFKFHGCPGPSIAMLHLNIQSIAQASHWLFENQGAAEGNDDPMARSENGPFSIALNVLCFDTSVLENDPRGLSSLYETFRSHLQIGDSGTTLTAGRFIELYKTTDEFQEPFDEGRDVGGAKIECTTRVLKAFKTKFNQN